ncbi:hypothetical protein E4T56_gene5330 [Termitomyces sp. T112]|nr:hypothetical protein E4T56_gene5330 [Termitomyces sp. T112]
MDLHSPTALGDLTDHRRAEGLSITGYTETDGTKRLKNINIHCCVGPDRLRGTLPTAWVGVYNMVWGGLTN